MFDFKKFRGRRLEPSLFAFPSPSAINTSLVMAKISRSTALTFPNTRSKYSCKVFLHDNNNNNIVRVKHVSAYSRPAFRSLRLYTCIPYPCNTY